MNKKKIVTRIALLLTLCFALVIVFTSCSGSNTAVKVDDGKWDKVFATEAESESGSGEESKSESTTESESATESATESESESESVSGADSVPPVADEENGGDNNEETTASTTTPLGTNKEKVEIEEKLNILDQVLSWIGVALFKITSIMPANSYLITLCIFAIVMELVFLPFGIKQHKNSIKQAKLKPKEMAIRKKYAGRNDQATQQKLNQEIQELYQQENYNPLSGCLPLLLQLPALIVIYWVVINPLRYVLGQTNDFMSFMYHYLKHLGHNPSSSPIELLNIITKLGNAEAFESGIFSAEKIGQWCTNPADVIGKLNFICDPANALNLKIGFIDLSEIPKFKFWEFGDNAMLWVLLLVPVLTFVVYFFSMRLNRKFSFQPTQNADAKQQACSNTMMDVTMPLMSVFITFQVPAAIGIYWMFKSMLGVLKQFILSKAMPFPTFTEEDFKAAEKEMAGKQPKKIQKSENAGKVRSLHHIDDEDYDEKGNYVPVSKKEEPESEGTTNDSAMANGTSIKDESDKQEKKFSFRDLFKKDKKDDK